MQTSTNELEKDIKSRFIHELNAVIGGVDFIQMLLDEEKIEDNKGKLINATDLIKTRLEEIKKDLKSQTEKEK